MARLVTCTNLGGWWEGHVRRKMVVDKALCNNNKREGEGHKGTG